FTLEGLVDVEYLLDIHDGHLARGSVREHIVGRHILSQCLYHVLGTREPFNVDWNTDHLVYRRIQLNGERRVAIVFRLLEILFSIIGYPEVQSLDGALYIRIGFDDTDFILQVGGRHEQFHSLEELAWPPFILAL